MNDLTLLAAYIIGVVVMAVVIRLVARIDHAEARLDRGAALTACLLWPGAVTLFALIVVAFLLMRILFGPEVDE